MRICRVVAALPGTEFSYGRTEETSPPIGLTSDDPHVDVEIALRCATTALPVASADRQKVLAVSVLAAARALVALDGRPAERLAERNRDALAQTPHATRWARQSARRRLEERAGSPTSSEGF